MGLVFNANTSAVWLAVMTARIILTGAPAMASSFQIIAQLGTSATDTGGLFDPLAADSKGNLYAEAYLSQSASQGGVYLLTAKSAYARVTMLYNFEGSGSIEAWDPSGGVTLTPSNNILGATSVSNTDGGTVFNLGTASDVSLGILHEFVGAPTDGSLPGGLVPGLFNHYYGVTTFGGSDTVSPGNSQGEGTVFDVSASVPNLKYEVLYRFGAPGDGIDPPTTKLAVDPQGRLYGVTYGGGAHGFGTVYCRKRIRRQTLKATFRCDRATRRHRTASPTDWTQIHSVVVNRQILESERP